MPKLTKIEAKLRNGTAKRAPWLYQKLLRARKSFTNSGLAVAWRVRSNQRRLAPTFFIAGVRKGGTSFMFRLLAQHPDVRSPRLKEVHFFSKPDRKNIDEYRSFFPIGKPPLVTGESTPHYMYYPQAAPALAKHFPNAKLILVLREPGGRAYSEYCMNVARGTETLGFPEALARESERITGEWQRSADEPDYWSPRLAEYSYQARGRYLEQIKRLEQFFPSENILVVKSDSLFKQTEVVLAEVEAFLGIRNWMPETIIPENVGNYKAKCPPHILEALKEEFALHDQALFEYLGWTSWSDGITAETIAECRAKCTKAVQPIPNYSL